MGDSTLTGAVMSLLRSMATWFFLSQGAVALLTPTEFRRLATRVVVQLHILDRIFPLLDASGHGGAHNCHRSTIPISGPIVEPESTLVLLLSGLMSLSLLLLALLFSPLRIPCNWSMAAMPCQGYWFKKWLKSLMLALKAFPMSRRMMLIYSREGWARWLPFGRECATFARK